MKAQTIGIIGLQRLGASVALAFRATSLEIDLVGHDRSRDDMRRAKEQNIVDRTYTSVVNLAEDADILIVAETQAQIAETFEVIGPYVQPHTVVIDLGTLKMPLQEAAKLHLKQGHYVAVMPIPTAEALHDSRHGQEAATADLFRDSVMCLMPSSSVEDDAVKTAQVIGSVLGCTPFFVDALEYDTYTQALETLPALMGAAYFRTLTRSRGWRDMVRFAGGGFAQATSPLGREEEIAHFAFYNKQAMLTWMDRFMEDMVELRRWIKDGDEEQVAALMTELNIQREEWLHERRENNWNESVSPKAEHPTVMRQLFGALGRRRGQDKG